jgi:hypothetical protein
MPAAWYRLTAAPNCRPRRLPLHPVRVPDRVKCLDLRCALLKPLCFARLGRGARRPEAQSLRFLAAGDKLILKYELGSLSSRLFLPNGDVSGRRSPWRSLHLLLVSFGSAGPRFPTT